MKESHDEGPASHIDPESCGGDRKVTGEALTGAHAGQVLSCETASGTPTPAASAVTTGAPRNSRLLRPLLSSLMIEFVLRPGVCMIGIHKTAHGRSRLPAE